MTHPVQALEALNRPILLVRAAHEGAQRYQKHRHLAGALRGLVSDGPVLPRLFEREAEYDALRRARRAEYDVAQHILTLSALICEVRALQETAPLLMAA